MDSQDSSAQVDSELSRLVSEYKDRHGYALDRATTAHLAQEAVMVGWPPDEERRCQERRLAWLALAARILQADPEVVTFAVMAGTRPS